MQTPTASNQDTRYLPIAPWTGRLILPQFQQRRPDGGIWIEIQNAPESHAQFKGQLMWLAWHPASIHQPWLARATRNIQFDSVTQESQAKGNLHPTRLNGWKQVSPLESLAGARTIDDMQVELDVFSVEQTSSGWVVRINDEPVQIEGTMRGFVQFVAPVEGKRYRVKHYDRATRSFTAAEETVAMPAAGTLHPQFNLEQSSIVNLEKLPLNAGGWYIYGSRGTDGQFVVQALEPAEMLRLPPERMIIGRTETQKYFDLNKWKQMPFQRIDTTLVDNNGQATPPEQRTSALIEKRTRELWQRGDEALVIHTFGWRGGSRGNKVPLVTGHFAFGFAKLLPDEFTGALRFRLVYRQIYAHSGIPIVAGAQSWHCYMGSFKRGWMYTIPVSEILLRMPELTVPYRMGTYTFDPLALIKRELTYMEARYRSGDGNGASVVTPATSCVRDSNQALFAAIRQFRDRVLKEPAVTTWLAANPNDFHARRFANLRSLLQKVEDSVLFPLGYVPRSWRGENDAVAAHDRDRGGIGDLLDAIRTWRTMLPRRAERELLAVLRDYGATLIEYQSANIGGEVPGLVPLPPGVLL